MKEVAQDQLVPGYYIVFNSHEGTHTLFAIKKHPTEGLCVWGLSHYRGSFAYRTWGRPLAAWLAAHEGNKARLRIYPDVDRTQLYELGEEDEYEI